MQRKSTDVWLIVHPYFGLGAKHQFFSSPYVLSSHVGWRLAVAVMVVRSYGWTHDLDRLEDLSEDSRQRGHVGAS